MATPARRKGRGRSRWLLWAVLAVPLSVETVRYVGGTLYYGEYLHLTGLQAVWLLLVTLSITPARRLLSPYRWFRWLAGRRRALGVATFAYSLAHTLAYLAYKRDAGLVLTESLELWLLSGWVGFGLFLALAVTSNDASVRALGANWRRLHRFVYPAAVLTLLHWSLSAFDPSTAWWHAALLALLLLLRLQKARSA